MKAIRKCVDQGLLVPAERGRDVLYDWLEKSAQLPNLHAQWGWVRRAIWLAELAVPPFESHGLSRGHTDPQFAFGGPASYISLRRKRKSRRELSSFPLHGIRGKDSSIRKSAKFLSHVLSLSSVYTYTHIRNRLSFSRWSLHVTSWASKRLEGKRAACLFDARGDIFRLFDRLNWLISRIWFASLFISSYAWENWNGCASNVNLQERIVGVAVFVLSKLVFVLPRFFFTIITYPVLL